MVIFLFRANLRCHVSPPFNVESDTIPALSRDAVPRLIVAFRRCRVLSVLWHSVIGSSFLVLLCVHPSARVRGGNGVDGVARHLSVEEGCCHADQGEGFFHRYLFSQEQKAFLGMHRGLDTSHG